MEDGNTIERALKQHFGFESFKGNQREIIADLLDGNDLFVLMPTGGGKSLCYQLPALMSEGTAIVISPLIALMKNQVDAIRQHCSDEGVAHFLNSALGKGAVAQVKSDILSGCTKLLYVAPESLTKQATIAFLRSVPISFYAVDEAHCISEWGHDFRPEYRKIRSLIDQIQRRPIIALTATATPKVQHDIQKNLGITDARVYKSSFNRPNLYYEVRRKTKDVDRDVIRFIKSNPGKSGIIYCLSRRRVEELTKMLLLNDIRAHAYHAGMDAVTRAANQDDFLMERVDVIVATIAFGMGIDKPDVRYVIHYDIPKSLEGYYQETGRGGRDGGEGVCIAFYSNKDLQKLDKLLQGKNPSEQEIGRQLLLETSHYAESSVCRRKILLSYFGEQMEGDRCGNCDNCRHPKTEIEAGNELQDVLKAIKALGERYKSEYIVAFVTGRITEEGRQHRHDSHDLFGEFDENSPTGSSAADSELLSILRDVRKKIARRLDVPPFVIFKDPVLDSMATLYPVDAVDFANIPGVGQAKANKFAIEFTSVIADYVAENEIIRPVDIKVRTEADTGKTRIYIIQSIDRKIDLEEIADSRGLEFDELLTELESIVEDGTRINIDYYLDEILDEDCQEEILDFMRSLKEDDLEAAIQELGEEYTEEEIRLMRVKFLASWSR